MQSRDRCKAKSRDWTEIPQITRVWMMTLRKKTASRLEEANKKFPSPTSMMVKGSLHELTCCMETMSPTTPPTQGLKDCIHQLETQVI